MPVQSLYYGTPAPGRPGLVTAIGILSIVMGSWGLLASGCASFYAIVLTAVSGTASRAMTVPTPGGQATVVDVTASGVEDVEVADAFDPQTGQRRMAAERRKLTLEAMESVHPLSESRRALLDGLLARSGGEMFTATAGQTGDDIKATISASGRVGSNPQDAAAADYYVIGIGRIEVDDAKASFYPQDGRPPTRATAEDVTVGDTGPGGLSDSQVQAILAIAQQLRKPGTLTAQQLATLQTALEAEGQQYVAPSPTLSGATAQLMGVADVGAGGVLVQFNQGMMQIDKQGKITSSFNYNSFGGAGPMAGLGPTFGRLMLLTAVGAVIGLALAVLLLAAGIVTLTQSQLGRRLHLIYAWVKIPVAMVTAVASAWAVQGYFAAMPGGSPGPVTLVMMVGAILLGCAYPVALLIVYRTKTMREYYAG
jgi:hypothetical protein